ncbi:MAG: response regulator [Cyanobacteria bacterium P01_F01_bin.53]
MSKSSFTILVAEDDDRSRQALVNSLRAVGYEVIVAADGQQAIDLFHATESVDLVILDVLMPRLDGFQVCKALRVQSDVPIIMATVLGSAADRVTGLEMGANDYIVKPFSTKELIARIRSILRRSPRRTEIPDKPSSGHSFGHALEVGQLRIDPITRKAYRGSQQLRLTEIEFRLLELLASRPGHIFSRGDILQLLWGYDASSATDTKTVDVHISRLRIKLKDNTQNPQFIVTIRGRGYMFLVQR